MDSDIKDHEAPARAERPGDIVEYFGGAALIDYVMLNAERPDVYAALPSMGALSALAPGDTVKVGLQSSRGDLYPEHFWVEIVERRGVRGFVGKVANDLQIGFGLKYGDRIVFCGHHVREIAAPAA